mmetsp:Transcript_31708/g.49656  ORF Transcript_31708/g.49656 Transcript_31708/m.49656 type:complete len:253 (+) Transcript_31708:521-1279(+)
MLASSEIFRIRSFGFPIRPCFLTKYSPDLSFSRKSNSSSSSCSSAGSMKPVSFISTFSTPVEASSPAEVARDLETCLLGSPFGDEGRVWWWRSARCARFCSSSSRSCSTTFSTCDGRLLAAECLWWTPRAGIAASPPSLPLSSSPAARGPVAGPASKAPSNCSAAALLSGSRCCPSASSPPPPAGWAPPPAPRPHKPKKLATREVQLLHSALGRRPPPACCCCWCSNVFFWAHPLIFFFLAPSDSPSFFFFC